MKSDPQKILQNAAFQKNSLSMYEWGMKERDHLQSVSKTQGQGNTGQNRDSKRKQGKERHVRVSAYVANNRCKRHRPDAGSVLCKRPSRWVRAESAPSPERSDGTRHRPPGSASLQSGPRQGAPTCRPAGGLLIGSVGLRGEDFSSRERERERGALTQKTLTFSLL